MRRRPLQPGLEFSWRYKRSRHYAGHLDLAEQLEQIDKEVTALTKGRYPETELLWQVPAVGLLVSLVLF